MKKTGIVEAVFIAVIISIYRFLCFFNNFFPLAFYANFYSTEANLHLQKGAVICHIYTLGIAELCSEIIDILILRNAEYVNCSFSNS